jgi:hypothetical protein
LLGRQNDHEGRSTIRGDELDGSPMLERDTAAEGQTEAVNGTRPRRTKDGFALVRRNAHSAIDNHEDHPFALNFSVDGDHTTVRRVTDCIAEEVRKHPSYQFRVDFDDVLAPPRNFDPNAAWGMAKADRGISHDFGHAG